MIVKNYGKPLTPRLFGHHLTRLDVIWRMEMSETEDPAQNNIVINNPNTDKARLKKENELRKAELRRVAKKRTLRALEELRDPSLNPFAELEKLKPESGVSKLSPDKVAAKEKRRKAALESTLAGLQLIREEMACKMAASKELSKRLATPSFRDSFSQKSKRS